MGLSASRLPLFLAVLLSFVAPAALADDLTATRKPDCQVVKVTRALPDGRTISVPEARCEVPGKERQAGRVESCKREIRNADLYAAEKLCEDAAKRSDVTVKRSLARAALARGESLKDLSDRMQLSEAEAESFAPKEPHRQAESPSPEREPIDVSDILEMVGVSQ